MGPGQPAELATAFVMLTDPLWTCIITVTEGSLATSICRSEPVSASASALLSP
jgi:hypothetical protein